MLGNESLDLLQSQTAHLSYAWRLEPGILGTDVRVEAAAGSGNRVGGNRRIGGEGILGSIIAQVLGNRVAQLLGRGAQVAAAGTSRIVAVARSRRAPMKILVGGKLLAQKPRTADRALGIDYQAAVGFVREECLAKPPNHQRVQTAAHDGQHQGHEDGAAKFSEKCFHIFEVESIESVPVVRRVCRQ